MRKGRGAIVALGILLLGLLSSVITYVGLSLLGLVDLNNKEILTFNVLDVEKEYDGTPLRADEYNLQGALPDGYSVYVDYLGEQTQVGSATSSLQIQIFDVDNKDVTSEFDVRINKGKIKVLPRNITIEVEEDCYYVEDNKVKVDLIEKEGAVSKLLLGHRLIGVIPDDFDIEKDDIKDLVITPKVVDSYGTDVTKYYNITFNKPLKLQKGAIEISVSHMVFEKEYDEKAFEPKIQIMSGELEKGHTLEVKSVKEETDVGVYTNYKVEFSVKDANNTNVTGLYKISGQRTITVEIKPRKITVAPETLEKSYDGIAFEKTDLKIVEGSLLPGHTASAKFSESITKVGTKTVTYTVEILNKEKVDVSKQYEIDKESNEVTIEVTNSKIELSIKKTSKEYDGENFGKLEDTEDYEIVSGGLSKGDKLEVTFDEDFKEVGKREVNVVVKIINEDGFDVTSTYELIYPEKLTVEIKGIVVEIQLESISKEYDGKSLNDMILDKLAHINLTIANEYGTQGLTGVTFVDEILNMSDVCEPFEITPDMLVGVGVNKDQYAFKLKEPATIEIKQREIYVQIIDGDDSILKKYTDKEISIEKTDIEVREGTDYKGLADNHVIETINSQKYTMDFSSNDIKLCVNSISIFDTKNNRDVTHNYKIDLEGVTDIELIFDEIEVNVVISDIEIDWNLLFDEYEDPTPTQVENAIQKYIKEQYKDKQKNLFEVVNKEDIPASSRIDLDGDYVIDEQKAFFEYSLSIDDQDLIMKQYNPLTMDYEDLNDYYDIYEINKIYEGTIVIKNAKRTIEVDLPSIQKEYDKTNSQMKSEILSEFRDEITSIPLSNGWNISNFEFVENIDVEPGIYTYTIENVAFSGKNSDEYAYRYQFVYKPGKVTITKQKVQFTLPSISYEYDANVDAASKVGEMLNGVEINDSLSINGSINSLDGIQNAGTYVYKIDKENNIQGYDSTYYDVTIIPGVVTITKKNVYVSIPSVTVSDSSLESISSIVSDVVSEAVENDDVIINVTVDSLDGLGVGTYSLAGKVKLELNDADSKNYNLVVLSYGSLVVNP